LTNVESVIIVVILTILYCGSTLDKG